MFPRFEELLTEAMNMLVKREMAERQRKGSWYTRGRLHRQVMPMERLYEETRIASGQNTPSLARDVGKTSSGRTESNRCTCFGKLARDHTPSSILQLFNLPRSTGAEEPSFGKIERADLPDSGVRRSGIAQAVNKKSCRLRLGMNAQDTC